MRPLVLVLACGSLLRAQDPAEQARVIEAQMEKSLAQQRESVRRQVGASEASGGSWFTVPWPRPPARPAAAPVAPIQRPSQPLASLCRPLDPVSMENHIRQAANQEGLSAGLLREVIRRESAFDPCAVSRKGALGLMQLMPETAAELGVRDPFNPVENLYGGARFLRQLLTRYGGNLSLALGAYNAGPTRVDEFGDIPPIPETQQYVRRILGILDVPEF